jgi:hypothetical protein
MTRQMRLWQISIWFGFASVFATAPAWSVIALGINPSLDEALSFICSGGRP